MYRRLKVTRGFSLLEMLVALVILSVSLGVIYHSTGLSSRIIATDRDSAQALVMAESLLAQSHLPEIKQTLPLQGSDDKFNWNIRRLAMPDHPLDEEFPLAFIEVKVSWQGALGRRDVTLYSLVPGL